MIEKIVMDYLNDSQSVPAYGETPEKPPAEYILVSRTGGKRENRINSATVAIQSIGGTLFRACEINEAVMGLMDIIHGFTPIYGAHLNTNYNFTNPATKTYRYQAVYDITY